MKILEIYDILLKHFGPQNWWPTSNNFSPKEWEICVGAVLTQNTNWENVEKALRNMANSNCKDAETILRTEDKELEKIIRSSGFYKQKTKKLKSLAKNVFGFGGTENFLKNVTRDELLNIKGIGKETADSILLYACEKPFFVVDAYTKRIFSRLGLIQSEDYETIRDFFESNIPKDIELYKEFHALIVRLAKEHCKKKPQCEECPLRVICKYSQ